MSVRLGMGRGQGGKGGEGETTVEKEGKGNGVDPDARLGAARALQGVWDRALRHVRKRPVMEHDPADTGEGKVRPSTPAGEPGKKRVMTPMSIKGLGSTCYWG